MLLDKKIGYIATFAMWFDGVCPIARVLSTLREGEHDHGIGKWWQEPREP